MKKTTRSVSAVSNSKTGSEAPFLQPSDQYLVVIFPQSPLRLVYRGDSEVFLAFGLAIKIMYLRKLTY